jgi:hypothetical protein
VASRASGVSGTVTPAAESSLSDIADSSDEIRTR